MKRPNARRIALIGVLALGAGLLLFDGVTAQTLHVSGLLNQLDNEVLGRPAGFSVGLTYPITERVGVWGSFQRSTDGFDSFGTTCVGLVPPTPECASEGRFEKGVVTGGAVGLSLPLLSSSGTQIVLLPGYRFARLKNQKRGKATGRTVTAEEAMRGPEIGAEMRAPLFGSRTFSVRLGLQLSYLPWNGDLVLDGGSPFVRDTWLGGASVGLAIDVRELVGIGG